jgi:hypothetical protein
MYLLVATVFPEKDHSNWLQIKFEKRNDGKRTWAVLRDHKVNLWVQSGIWDYYPAIGELVFKIRDGKITDDDNNVMGFSNVRTDFLDVFSSITCKGPGGWCPGSHLSHLPVTDPWVWVAGPGLHIPPKHRETIQEDFDPAKRIVPRRHYYHMSCPEDAVICPDPEALPRDAH